MERDIKGITRMDNVGACIENFIVRNRLLTVAYFIVINKFQMPRIFDTK